MRLPDSVYQQVLQGLGLGGGGMLGQGVAETPAGEPPDGECKRRSFRRKLDAEVHFVRHGAFNLRPQACTLVDVSRDGVCVMMESVVAPGERFVLHLPRASDTGDGTEVLALLCTARSSRLKASGRFRTGAEFTDPAEVEAEQAAFARAAHGLTPRAAVEEPWMRTTETAAPRPQARTRQSNRHDGASLAVLHLYRDNGQHGEPETVQIRDYSDTGVGILRDAAMAVGDEFVVRIPREGEPPVTRLCRVVNVAVAADRHRIGAEFIPFPGPRGRGFMARLREWIA